MNPFRTPAEPPATSERLTQCFLNPHGRVEVLEEVRRGALFEVFRVRAGERVLAVKSPRRMAPSGPLCWQGTVEAFGVTSFAVGRVETRSCSAELWPWLSFALLSAEAEQVRSTLGKWNHSVISFGQWDEGDLAHLDVAEHTHQLDRRFRPALVMPWHDGVDFASIERDEQRALFPSMLPALWDALEAARHRDLSPSNLRLSMDKTRFVLLDPGVHIESIGTGVWDGAKCDELELLTTNTMAYPILHPSAPTRNARADAAAFKLWPPGTLTRVGPSPADWLAAGVLYYQILTGEHPFYRPGFDQPGWCGTMYEWHWKLVEGSVIADPDLPRWRERCSDKLASAGTVTDRERELALSLLSLSFASREALTAALPTA